VSLNAYRIFTEIVASGSLADTARTLHLSPSAVSKHLSRLEQRLGVKLLQRSTRSLQVTEAGERFYHRCLDILHAAALAETEARDSAGDPSGTLSLTLPEVMATPETAALIQSFTAKHSSVSVDIEVSNNPRNLIEKGFDAGFRVGPLQDSQLVASELFRANIVLAASPDYVKQHGEPPDVAALASHPLIVPDPVYLTASSDGADSKDALNPKQCLVCDNTNMLIEMAKAGAGIAMLWDSSARQALASGELVELKSPVAHEPRPVSIIYLSRDYLPQRMRLFVEHVKQHYRAQHTELSSS